MRLYRYWVKCSRDIALPIDGRHAVQPTSVFGYSNESPEGARACGERLLANLEHALANDEMPWTYDERPVREEILAELSPENIVTRNRYGAEVLNSTQLVFVDIDGSLPAVGGLLGWLKGLFGDARLRANDDPAVLERVRELLAAAGHSGTLTRIYRTRAGYRLMMPECPVSGRDSGPLMKALHADKLYALLCQRQDCYRARLTPKPHRIRLAGRHFAYPQEDREILAEQVRWLEKYDRKRARYAVCRYVGTVNGPAEAHSPIPAVRYHDDRTKAHTTLPLA